MNQQQPTWGAIAKGCFRVATTFLLAGYALAALLFEHDGRSLLITAIIAGLLAVIWIFPRPKKIEKSETGVYVVDEDGKIDPLYELPGNGSINEITAFLGLAEKDCWVILMSLYNADTLDWVIFRKSDGKAMVFEVKQRELPITYKIFNAEIAKIDWEHEKNIIINSKS